MSKAFLTTLSSFFTLPLTGPFSPFSLHSLNSQYLSIVLWSNFSHFLLLSLCHKSMCRRREEQNCADHKSLSFLPFGWNTVSQSNFQFLIILYLFHPCGPLCKVFKSVFLRLTWNHIFCYSQVQGGSHLVTVQLKGICFSQQ